MVGGGMWVDKKYFLKSEFFIHHLDFTPLSLYIDFWIFLFMLIATSIPKLVDSYQTLIFLDLKILSCEWNERKNNGVNQRRCKNVRLKPH
jgi:hypothetical protein